MHRKIGTFTKKWQALPKVQNVLQNKDIVVKNKQYRDGYSHGFRKAWQYQEQFIRILQRKLDDAKPKDSHNYGDVNK